MQQLGIWVLAALALLGVVAFWLLQSNETQAPQTIAQTQHEPTAEPTDSAVPASQENAPAAAALDDAPLQVDGRQIAIGGLTFGQYFNQQELATLGFSERNPAQVRRWADLDLHLLAKGLQARIAVDVIPSIDTPRFVSPEQAGEWLSDEELVVGIRFKGIARAYPISTLNWHEIVNDEFDGTAVVVTYCPLCNSSLAFVAPTLNGQAAEFGTSGRLYQSDLVMYDRVTGTFWSQLEAGPIIGPLVGEHGPLTRLPVDMVPFGLWKADHPDTLVLDRPRAGDRVGNKLFEGQPNALYPRNYTVDPYARYRLTNPEKGQRTQFGIPINDDRLKAKDSVIGIAVDGHTKAYALEALKAQRLLNDFVGEVPVLAVVGPSGNARFFERTDPASGRVLTFTLSDGRLRDDQGGSWSLLGEGLSGTAQGQQLKEVVGQIAFWFAWITFNPESDVFYGEETAL